MLRKTTGIALMLVMIAIIALQHPVLKFCACHKVLVLIKCPCFEEVEEPVVETSSYHDCCGEPPVSEPICKTKDSSDDCVVSLTLDLGDYLAFGNFEFHAYDGGELYLEPSYFDIEVLSPEKSWALDRGSSEPPSLISQVPLFIRHSVYLI